MSELQSPKFTVGKWRDYPWNYLPLWGNCLVEPKGSVFKLNSPKTMSERNGLYIQITSCSYIMRCLHNHSYQNLSSTTLLLRFGGVPVCRHSFKNLAGKAQTSCLVTCLDHSKTRVIFSSMYLLLRGGLS